MGAEEAIRKAIRVWMRDVLAQKNWSASQWAKLAGTSASNITRVLNPVNKVIPNAETLSKLSRVAGSQPNLNAFVQKNTVPSIQLYVINARALQNLGTTKALWRGVVNEELEAPRTVVGTGVSEPAFVYQVSSAELDSREIRQGDQLVIEQVSIENVSAGDIVLAIHKQTGEPVLGEYHPPVLTRASSDRELGAVQLTHVSIVGKASRHIRSL